MREEIFVGRINDISDRDACFYIENDHRDICDHLIFQGACYSGFYEDIKTAIENNNVESYLNKEELLDFLDNKEKFDYYVGKLTSKEGIEFKNKIMEDEHEMLKNDYNLTDEDINYILDNYTLGYEDRAIIGAIYHDTYEAGCEYITSCYTIPDYLDGYIDYEKFGEDLCENENYLKLDDGRVVSLSY
jgi:hypothetical protein